MNRTLSRTIRELAEENFKAGAERVMFLGAHGEVRAIADPSGGGDPLLAKRAELLRSNELAAVAHLGVAQIPEVMQISMIEVINPLGAPLVHSLITWPHVHRWTNVPSDAAEKWRTIWQKGGTATD